MLGTANSQAAIGAPDPAPKGRPMGGLLGAQVSGPKMGRINGW